MTDDRRPTRRSPLDLVDRPWTVGVAAGLVAAVVVGLRVAVAGRGEPGRLVLLGSEIASPGHRFAIPVQPGTGYDGEFYYRFALGPFHFARTWSGITLDGDFRFNRIAYPVFAWLLAAGGHPSLVPWSLLVVNILGIGALGWLGAVLARSQGHHGLWGLVLPAYGGFLWSLGRDLTEITESVFVVGALVALRRRNPAWAGVLLAVAVLSRETAMGVVGVLLAVDVARRIPAPAAWLRAHGRLLDDRAVALTWAWLVPLATFSAWQLLVRTQTGKFPILVSGQSNLGPPLAGFLSALRHYLGAFPDHASLSWFGELFVLAVVVVLAARTLRGSTAPGYERLCWGLYLLIVVCLTKSIWQGDVGFRSLDDLYVLSCVLLLTSPRLGSDRVTRLLPVLSAGAWLLVAAQVVHDV